MLFPTGECRVCLNHCSNPQKNGQMRTSDQSEIPEPVGRIPSFQDRRYFNTMGFHKTRQLDGEGRSEGCIIHHSSLSLSSRRHQPLLRFLVEKVQYQFTWLPFSLLYTQWTFTKVGLGNISILSPPCNIRARNISIANIFMFR